MSQKFTGPSGGGRPGSATRPTQRNYPYRGTSRSSSTPKYITNYIGSKQKLVDWIWDYTPPGMGTVADAFSGSAVVAYMYKTKGLRVLANDRLRYCYHAARAIIENNDTRLSDEDVEALLADNPDAGVFVRETFAGLYFADGVHELIDTVRANCDKFSGYKRDLALFALGRTCVSGKSGFKKFSTTTKHEPGDTPEEFKERLRKNVARINALVFDNGKKCKAFRMDINDFLPEVKADIAYFDPPYATEFSSTNYEMYYHFVEGLMTYWDGLTIRKSTKNKLFESDYRPMTKSTAVPFFLTFLGNAAHIPYWIVSYRDRAFPGEDEMRRIIASLGRDVQVHAKNHLYNLAARHGEPSRAKEMLFVCEPQEKKSYRE